MRLSALTTPKTAHTLVALALGAICFSVSSTATGNEFIVSSQVVSDEAAVSSNYVGDMSSTDAGVGGESILSSNDGSYADGGAMSSASSVGMNERTYGQPDLFYNFYTQGQANRANAQMYVSPNPVPKHVGHTYYTYQPFYPHEYLYGHTNKFHNYYDNGRGMNRTRAAYSTQPVQSAFRNIYWNKLRLPR